MDGYGCNDQEDHNVSFLLVSLLTLVKKLTVFSFSCEAQLIPTVVALGMLIQYTTSYNSFINFFFMYVRVSPQILETGLMNRICHPKIPAVTFMGEYTLSAIGVELTTKLCSITDSPCDEIRTCTSSQPQRTSGVVVRTPPSKKDS